jgi:hypothetical protein
MIIFATEKSRVIKFVVFGKSAEESVWLFTEMYEMITAQYQCALPIVIVAVTIECIEVKKAQ